MKKISIILCVLCFILVAQAQNVAVEGSSIDEEIYTVCEQAPQFPGGMEAMHTYVVQNTQYPQAAIESAAEGTVRVQFVVEKSGNITHVKVMKSVNEYLDKEAVRVVNTMPQWIPAEHRGVKVRHYVVLPIVFTLK